jgi:hypothetical protein
MRQSKLEFFQFILQKPQVKIESDFLTGKKSKMKWMGMKTKPIELKQNEGHFDLSLEMIETENNISSCLRYKTDIFKHKTIKSMVKHYLTLLKETTSDSGFKISKLSSPTQTKKNNER